VKRNPYSVVLLDEIEKAHPDVFNILLQVFEDGHLTDGLGNTIDFKNTILIMTSNIGARFIEKKGRMGFASNDVRDTAERVNEMVMGEVKRTFNPEFINRVDEIIRFQALTEADLEKIVGIQLDTWRRRLAERRIELDISEAAMAHLAREGFDPAFGARPLKRAIQRLIENPLAKLLLEQPPAGDAAVRVDAADGAIELRVEPAVALVA
jgi:ATP-dependent Clp protease ATP-binding subunit ClpA